MTHPALQAQSRIATPLGTMTAAASAAGLAGLWFDDQAHHPGPLAVSADAGHPHLQAAARALAAYFDGAATPLDGVVLDLHGTPFQRAVWQALIALPRGATSTYGRIAADVGSPAAVRAAGAAIGRNPVSVLVPCHRVLGQGGGLTGYAGGLHRKTALLQAEGVWMAPPRNAFGVSPPGGRSQRPGQAGSATAAGLPPCPAANVPPGSVDR